jgi:hypothetical protein
MKKLSLNRILRRTNIWINRKIKPKENRMTTKTEREAISIFNNLVKHPESELLIHPAEKYYIKSHKVGIFITLSRRDQEISIINHVYGYNVGLSERVLNIMLKTFTDEVENRRIKMEEEYTNNIQHSLSIIAKTIKERL